MVIGNFENREASEAWATHKRSEGAALRATEHLAQNAKLMLEWRNRLRTVSRAPVVARAGCQHPEKLVLWHTWWNQGTSIYKHVSPHFITRSISRTMKYTRSTLGQTRRIVESLELASDFFVTQENNGCFYATLWERLETWSELFSL